MSFILNNINQIINQVGLAPMIVIGLVILIVIWWVLRP